MRNALIVVAAAVTFASQVSGQVPVQSPAPTKVEITFEGNGVMSLAATNASLREILTEWTRKGGTPFVGAERLTGANLSLQFDHKSETEVIASLLRGASGYVVRDRLTPSNLASNTEVVYILATSTATSSGYTPTSSYVPPPQPTTTGNPGVEIPPANPGQAGPPPTTEAPPPTPPYRAPGTSGVAVPVITVPVPTPTPPPPGGRGGGGGR